MPNRVDPSAPIRCRFVQNNALESLNGLEQLPQLETLNVSNNRLTHLEGLAACSSLITLLGAHNDLSSVESMSALFQCPRLSTVDLQENSIADTQVACCTPDILKHMGSCKALSNA